MKKKVVAPLSRHCGKARVAQKGRFFLLGVGTERCYARKRETDGFGFGVGHSHRPATVKTSFLSPLPSLSVFEGQGEKEANMLAHFFRQNSKRTVNKFEGKLFAIDGSADTKTWKNLPQRISNEATAIEVSEKYCSKAYAKV